MTNQKRGGRIVFASPETLAKAKEHFTPSKMPMPEPEQHHPWCHDPDLDCEHKVQVENGGKCGIAGAGPCIKSACLPESVVPKGDEGR